MARDSDNISKKKGGRHKGTPNKVSTFTRVILANILSDYQSSGLMEQDLALLEPKDRLRVMVELVPFVVPKLSATDVNLADQRQRTIDDTLAQLATPSD